MFLRFIHAVIKFFFFHCCVIHHCLNVPVSSIDRHLGCSSLGLLRIKLPWIFYYKSLCEQVFIFLDKFLGSELLDHRANVCLVLEKNSHDICQHSYSILHVNQQCLRVLFSLHPLQYLVLSVFLILAFLADV